jgi:hypothetical protein
MSRLVKYADELVTSVGPRPGASKGEHQAAELIAQNFDEIGLDTYIQEFKCARSTGWVRILYYALAALSAFILFFSPTLKIVALVLALVGAVLLILDLLGKNPLFNLFNKGLSQNVVARYSPDGSDSRRKIVVVAHYDSGRSMVQCAPPLASSYVFLRKLIRSSIVGLLVVIVLSLFPLPDLLLLTLGILGVVMGIVLAVAAIFEIINLFMPFNQGANCNASGIATLYGIAQSLTGFRPSRAANSAEKTRPRSGRSQRAADDEDADDTERPKRRGGGAAAGAAGAAGSLFSKAKGLVSKRSKGEPEETGFEDYAEPDDEYRLDNRAGSGGGGATLKRGGAGAVRMRGAAVAAADGADFNADSTADLGSAVAEAAAYAAGGAAQGAGGSLEAGARLAGAAGGSLAGASGEARSTGAIRSTSNPRIRTRPPLAAQEEQDRKLREEAAVSRKQTGRGEDGMPEWFLNAKKKAAQKEATQRSKSPEDRETVRSQFADVPLDGKDIAKAAVRSTDGIVRGDGIKPKVAKSIFAEPELQSARPDDEQDGVDSQAAIASEAGDGLADGLLQAGGAVGQDVGEEPAVSAGAQDEAAASADAAAAAGEAVSSGHVVKRTAAELLQERLSGGSPSSSTQQVGAQNPAEPNAAQAQGSLAAFGQAVQPQADQAAAQTPAAIPQVTLPQVSASQPSSLQMDFSGLDRLASDAQPDNAQQTTAQTASQISNNEQPPNPGSRLASLPNTISPLEQATVAPTPAVPINDRLQNLPRLSLGDSGMIPTQQAAFDQQASPSEQMHQPSDSLVSSTGSFAPLGATGLMKPVGEELLSYHEDDVDIYIDDSDDSVGNWAQTSRAEPGAVTHPQIMDIPQSRTKSFFGGLGDKLSGGKKRGDDLESLPSAWLGVEDDFDARHAGTEIGSWDNFTEEDDDGWKGGAYGGSSDDENREAMQNFSYELIDKEVWLVALGSHENKNAGLKNFLYEHERELRNAFIVNIDSVGAGDLCFTVSEGTFRPLNTDHRLQNVMEAASRSIGADLEPVSFTGYTTDASAALKEGMRAISLLGLGNTLPVGWRWSDDRLDIIEEKNLQNACDVVIEVIKSC